METQITKLEKLHPGLTDDVKVRGWLETIKTFRKFRTLMLRDGVGKLSHVQVIVPKTVPIEGKQTELMVEAYVEITGKVTPLPEEKYSCRPFEIQATHIVVLGASDSSFLERCPKTAGPEVRLDERHLYLRDPKFCLITKLRSVLVKALRKHFESDGLTEIFPPSFVGNQCEGGATLFKLKYPARDTGDVDAYLTQSSQFYLEYALPGMGETYCIAPSFRAEKSQTRRHLTEFLHAECEWSGILTLEEHCSRLEDLMKGVASKFLKYGKEYLDELGLTERVEELVQMCDDIQVVTHRSAVDYCKEHGIYKDEETKEHFSYEDDIPEMQERAMIDKMGKLYF
jgi:asparaginyl-tRNA synthetase